MEYDVFSFKLQVVGAGLQMHLLHPCRRPCMYLKVSRVHLNRFAKNVSKSILIVMVNEVS